MSFISISDYRKYISYYYKFYFDSSGRLLTLFKNNFKKDKNISRSLVCALVGPYN